MTKTSSNIPIPEHIDYQGSPKEKAGEFPYTRGVHSSMYRDRGWTMRQYAGFSTAEESNKRYKELLGKGAKGLSVAFDLPTQMGHDSDSAMALGEVGKVGVAIDTIEDMRVLFDGIDFKTVSTSMTINATAAILLLMYECVAEENGVASKDLRGTIQNDILKEYIARGTYIYPPTESLRIITDIFEYCSEHIPQWNTISISGYHIREAGSTATQEIAFTLANGLTYVESAIEKGLSIDEFAPRLSFFFNVHNNFLEEVAKFRAARKLWATLIKDRYNPRNEKSLKLRFHSQVAGSTLTAQQPLNNVARVTMQAMAAILGGTQSLHTNSFDEALQLPTSLSAEVALRTQQVLSNESKISDFVDPLAGSHAVEYLTAELEKGALEYLSLIENKGGVVKCIEEGYIQNEISDASYQFQKKLESKEEIVVGVNDFKESVGFKVEKNKVSEESATQQIKKLKKFKNSRDFSAVEESLEKLGKAADSTDNLLPFIKKAIRNKATLGEISNLLRTKFGTFTPPPIL